MQNRKNYITSLETKVQSEINTYSDLTKAEFISESENVAKFLNLNQNEYLEFLFLLYAAFQSEQPSHSENDAVDFAKNQAGKLIITFGSVAAAKNYLNRYVNVQATKPEKRKAKLMIHDACSFSLPNPPLNWNPQVWQKILAAIKPSGPQDEVMRLLPLADKIEAYIADSRNHPMITQIVEDEIKNETILRYKAEYKNHFAGHFGFSEDDYIAYKLNKDKAKIESLRKSTIKAKLAQIIPLSEKISLSTLKKVANYSLYKRAYKNPEAALLFFSHNISEEKYELYLSLTPNTSHAFIPHVEINGAEIKDVYKDYVISKLDSHNPEAAVLGKITSCCQFFGDTGESCAIHGITSPHGGFYVLRNRESQEIIAQCWAWEDGRGNIMFDSVEITLNSREKHRAMIVDFYTHLAQHLIKKKNVNAVMVGKNIHVATPDELAILSPLSSCEPADYTEYRDSLAQFILAHHKLPFLQPGYDDPNTNINGVPYQLDKSASLLWCDLAFTNRVNWKLSNEIVTFDLTEEEMNERTQLSTLWIENIENISDPEIWKTLRGIANKINVELRDDHGEGKPALYYAIKAKNLEIVKCLVEELTKTDRAAINNSVGNYSAGRLETAAKLAWIGEDFSIIKYLYEQGASFNHILYSSAFSEDGKKIECMKFLIEELGIDITKKGPQGETIFTWVIFNKKALKYLVDYTRSKNIFMQLMLETLERLIDVIPLINEDERVTLIKLLGTKYLMRTPNNIILDLFTLLHKLPATHHKEFINMVIQEQLPILPTEYSIVRMFKKFDSNTQCLLLNLIGNEQLRHVMTKHGHLKLNKDLAIEAKAMLIEMLGYDCLNNMFLDQTQLEKSLKYLKDGVLQTRLLSAISKEKLQALYDGRRLNNIISCLEDQAQLKLLEILQVDGLITIFKSNIDAFSDLLIKSNRQAQMECLAMMGSDGLYTLFKSIDCATFTCFLEDLPEDIQINVIRTLGTNLKKLFANDDIALGNLLSRFDDRPYVPEKSDILSANASQTFFPTNNKSEQNNDKEMVDQSSSLSSTNLMSSPS